MNLPGLYAKVVEKHPALGVFNGPFTDEEVGDRALIADHWTEMLPVEHWIYRVGPVCWIVSWQGPGREIESADDAPTHLEALAAFWLAYEGEVMGTN